MDAFRIWSIPVTSNKTLLGIAAGIVAGAFWGLVFLAPRLAADFPPLQLSAGRYLAYGLVAVVLVLLLWHHPWNRHVDS